MTIKIPDHFPMFPNNSRKQDLVKFNQLLDLMIYDFMKYIK